MKSVNANDYVCIILRLCDIHSIWTQTLDSEKEKTCTCDFSVVPDVQNTAKPH